MKATCCSAAAIALVSSASAFAPAVVARSGAYTKTILDNMRMRLAMHCSAVRGRPRCFSFEFALHSNSSGNTAIADAVFCIYYACVFQSRSLISHCLIALLLLAVHRRRVLMDWLSRSPQGCQLNQRSRHDHGQEVCRRPH
eukprot:9225-Heterococcus_DN1.PRE.6